MISRSNMGSQLWGNKAMKKKSKKMAVGMKQGGSVKKKRDGICVKGKTKGRMV